MPRPPVDEGSLPRGFYDRRTERVAADLLGKALLRRIGGQWIGGVIVETEAYLAEHDLASHSARGRTRGNASMFGIPGTLYVYPIHAKHCLNAVTEGPGRGAAVLIRAVEPVWGLALMKRHRSREDPRRLTSGPAMLCQALRIDRGHDGLDLAGKGPIRIVALPGVRPASVRRGPRIGIRRDTDLPLRFVIADNPFLSRKPPAPPPEGFA